MESLDWMLSTNVSLLGWLPTFNDLSTLDEFVENFNTMPNYIIHGDSNK